MIRPVSTYTKITSKHGSPAPGSRFGRHLGLDYACPVGTPVLAPLSGRVLSVSTGAAGGKTIEMQGVDSRLWRFLHLSSFGVKAGSIVSEGQQIALSGNTGITTGPHLHTDVRKNGTKWDASFDNYYDPEVLLVEANKPKQSTKYNLPPVGSRIKLTKGVTRTVFDKSGGTLGTIYASDETYEYTVRSHNNNRIGIQSAKFGRQVELALYYLNGGRIDGWKEI